MLLLKKNLLIVLMCLSCLSLPVGAFEAAPQVSARAGIVYHPASGQILWSEAPHERRLIASTTKIMTCLVALEHGKLSDEVKISPHAAHVDGSSMYLQEGETYTMEDLLYGLMLASGNDAATAIAEHVAGGEEAFAALMNEKAESLGLRDTSFANPHGLDAETHYSSAYDLARLMAYAMERSDFREITGSRTCQVKGLTYVNHNKLLWQCEGVMGGKTGYTKKAGRALITVCQRGGERLICVTLNDPDDWRDHPALYAWAYANFKPKLLIAKDTRFAVPLVSEHDTKLYAEPLRDVQCFVREDFVPQCRVELPRFAYPPVHRGDKAGRVLVRLNGEPIGEIPLLYMEELPIRKK